MISLVNKKRESLISILPEEISGYIFYSFDFHCLIKIRLVCIKWNEWIKEELESKKFCINAGLPYEIFGFENILKHFSSQYKKMNFGIPKMYEIHFARTFDEVELTTCLNSNFILTSTISEEGVEETIVIFPSKGHLIKTQLNGLSSNCLYNKRGDLFLVLRSKQNKYWELHWFSFYEKEIHKKIILNISITTKFVDYEISDNGIFWVESTGSKKPGGMEYKSERDVYSMSQDLLKEGKIPIIKTHKVKNFQKMNVIGNKIYFYNFNDSSVSCYLYESESLILQKQYFVNDLETFDQIKEINGKTYLWTCRGELNIDTYNFYCLEDDKHLQKFPRETRNEPFNSKSDTFLKSRESNYYCKSHTFESEDLLFSSDLDGFQIYEKSHDALIFQTKKSHPLPKLLKDTISCKQDDCGIDDSDSNDFEKENYGDANNLDDNDNSSDNDTNGNIANDNDNDIDIDNDNDNDANGANDANDASLVSKNNGANSVDYNIELFEHDNINNFIDDANMNSDSDGELENFSNEKISADITSRCWSSEYDDSIYLPEKNQKFIQPISSKKKILLPTNRNPNICRFGYSLHGFVTYEECAFKNVDKIVIYDYFS